MKSLREILKTIDGIKHKKCSKCLIFKPYSAFAKMSRVSFGLQPKCRECAALIYQTNPNKEKLLARQNIVGKRLRQELRLEALTHYSGGIPRCACCGESTLEFLCIDHINGGGNKHRKELGNAKSKNFARWLKHNNYPAGFQTLCHNCNMAKGFYGACPHKER